MPAGRGGRKRGINRIRGGYVPHRYPTPAALPRWPRGPHDAVDAALVCFTCKTSPKNWYAYCMGIVPRGGRPMPAEPLDCSYNLPLLFGPPWRPVWLCVLFRAVAAMRNIIAPSVPVGIIAPWPASAPQSGSLRAISARLRTGTGILAAFGAESRDRKWHIACALPR
jgi:hypothetical protein